MEAIKKTPQIINNKKPQHSTNNIQQDTQIRNNMKPQDTTKKTQQYTTRYHKTQQIRHNKLAQIRNKNKLLNTTSKIQDSSRHQK